MSKNMEALGQTRAELIQEALARDIVFLEEVTIKGEEQIRQPAKRQRQQAQVSAEKGLRSEMMEYDGKLEKGGIGVKIDNPHRMACYEFALYGANRDDLNWDDFVLISQDPAQFLPSQLPAQFNGLPVLMKHGSKLFIYGVKGGKWVTTEIRQSPAINLQPLSSLFKENLVVLKKDDPMLTPNIIKILKEGHDKKPEDFRTITTSQFTAPKKSIEALVKYLRDNPSEARNTVFDPQPSVGLVLAKETGIFLDGYATQRDVPLGGESTDYSRTRQTRGSKKKAGYFIEHFVLHLPRGCFLETVPSRCIMCTAPDYHMEDRVTTSSGLHLNDPVEINYITRNQLMIINQLVMEALRLNSKYQLAQEPEITRYYHMLRDIGWISQAASELNPDTTTNERTLVEVCEKLHVVTKRVPATQTFLMLQLQPREQSVVRDMEEIIKKAGLSDVQLGILKRTIDTKIQQEQQQRQPPQLSSEVPQNLVQITKDIQKLAEEEKVNVTVANIEGGITLARRDTMSPTPESILRCALSINVAVTLEVLLKLSGEQTKAEEIFVELTDFNIDQLRALQQWASTLESVTRVGVTQAIKKARDMIPSPVATSSSTTISTMTTSAEEQAPTAADAPAPSTLSSALAASSIAPETFFDFQLSDFAQYLGKTYVDGYNESKDVGKIKKLLSEKCKNIKELEKLKKLCSGGLGGGKYSLDNFLLGLSKLEARGKKKDDQEPPPPGATPAVPSGSMASQQEQEKQPVEVTPTQPPQQVAKASHDATVVPTAFKTLTEQVGRNRAWQDVIKKSLKDACRGDDSILSEVDRKVGEYFGKERALGKTPSLLDIQGVLTKTAREELEQKMVDQAAVKVRQPERTTSFHP